MPSVCSNKKQGGNFVVKSIFPNFQTCDETSLSMEASPQSSVPLSLARRGLGR